MVRFHHGWRDLTKIVYGNFELWFHIWLALGELSFIKLGMKCPVITLDHYEKDWRFVVLSGDKVRLHEFIHHKRT